MTRCEAGTGSSTVPRKAFTGGYEDVQKIQQESKLCSHHETTGVKKASA